MFLQLACLFTFLTAALATAALAAQDLIPSPGRTTYRVDPLKGDDNAPVGQPWRSFAPVNARQLAPGDVVEIAPGTQAVSLAPHGGGTAEAPVVFRFQPGTHTFAPEKALSEPMFVSNACDAPTTPKPICVLVRGMRHVRFEGPAAGPRPRLVAGGRMVQWWNDQSEDVTITRLTFDLARPTVSEFLVEKVDGATVEIRLAQGSTATIEQERLRWTGDGNPGTMTQEVDALKCWRSRTPPGWSARGQDVAVATDLGDRRVRLVFPDANTGLTAGRQYQLRNPTRDRVGFHASRCKRLIFRDLSVHALVGMGFVSQFTDTITIQRVDVAPEEGSGRRNAAWADIFQFSNCRGAILVDGCRLSGMSDDAINAHGTHLRIIDSPAPRQLTIRYVHPQTYGFAPYVRGDELAVVAVKTLREYADNPRRHVTNVEQQDERTWRLTLDGEVPRWEKNDVVDNITWHPDLTARDNHVSMDPVRGFLVTVRGKVLIEGNTFQRCWNPGILIEDDAKDWFESGPVRDVTIRGNRFVNCGIQITPHAAEMKAGEPIHENIRIMDNHFQELPYIFARGVGGLTIRGNTSFPKPLGIHVEPSCTGVVQEDNRVAWSPEPAPAPRAAP